jgi:hypothetical protein
MTLKKIKNKSKIIIFTPKIVFKKKKTKKNKSKTLLILN